MTCRSWRHRPKRCRRKPRPSSNRPRCSLSTFGANVGTVFSVEGEEGARYAVVWLADESEKDDGAEVSGDGTKSPVEL